MNEAAEFPHVLFHDDLSDWEVGYAHAPGVEAISRGLGRYIETEAPGPGQDLKLVKLFPEGRQFWRDYRFRAVVTPLSFDGCGPLGGFCGIFARYRSPEDFVALVLDKGYQLKLLLRTAGGFRLLANAPLEFCFGQSLTLTLKIVGQKITGIAGPYSGATKLEVDVSYDGPAIPASGYAGFVSAAKARYGPHTVECIPEEAERIKRAIADAQLASAKIAARYPAMKLAKTVPLQHLASRENVLFADLNGDGRPELLLAQSSKKIAAQLSLTRLTCLTAMDLDGKILWQAGVPDDDAHESGCEIRPAHYGALPFKIQDLFGDGHPVVVCVFGYDLQIRDAKTGRLMMSAGTPDTRAVSDEFKAVTSNFGAPWGDETLNMNVASISFCDTQGNGGRREILIKDDYHNLAVLDTMSDPLLHPIMRHRGNLGGDPWIGDIDGDGKDEILCGYSLLDDDGKLLANLALGGRARSVSVLAHENDSGGIERRVYICAGEEGLIALDMDALRAGEYSGEIPESTRVRGLMPSDLVVAKFRSDLAGEQLVVQQRDGWLRPVTMLDNSGARLWKLNDLFALDSIKAIQWQPGAEALMLVAIGQTLKLVSGAGQVVVESESSGCYCDVIPDYGSEKRPAILSWDMDKLSIFVPADH